MKLSTVCRLAKLIRATIDEDPAYDVAVDDIVDANCVTFHVRVAGEEGALQISVIDPE